MKYTNITPAKFITRHNRFVAEVELGGERVLCHVKNTGRCRELLTDGATVYLEKSANPERKYQYSLVAVEKGERLVNMDSSAPNKAVYEWLKKGEYFRNITLIKPESSYGNSRLDFYFEYEGKKAYMEVKGVTLESEGVVSFPDAPTERGVKHLQELIKLASEGFEAYAMFVVQMRDVLYFTANGKNDPDFEKALKKAQQKGVKILCFDCDVKKDEMSIKNPVKVSL